jgi:hypothetical protein
MVASAAYSDTKRSSRALTYLLSMGYFLATNKVKKLGGKPKVVNWRFYFSMDEWG